MPEDTALAVPDWRPGRYALWSSAWSAQGESDSILLRHPFAPYPSSGWIVKAINERTIRRLALDYLKAVEKNTDIVPPIVFPEWWIKQLEHPGLEPTFGWLPIRWPDPSRSDPGDPFVSFEARRYRPGGGAALPERTIVLFASEWGRFDAGKKPERRVLGSGFGIRVVAHARKVAGGKFEVRITGLSATLPNAACLVHGWSTRDPTNDSPLFSALTTNNLDEIKSNIGTKVGLKHDSFSLRGVRLAQLVKMIDGKQTQVVQAEWRTTSKPRRDNRNASPVASLVLETGPVLGDKDNEVVLVSSVELVADQGPGEAMVFPLDPPSQNGTTAIHERRPSRFEDPFLNPFRFAEDITAAPKEYLAFPLPPAPPAPPPPVTSELMEVMTCPGFVVTDNPQAGQIKIVDLPPAPSLDQPHARSNTFSAVSAFTNVEEFFTRLDAYGLGAAPYFRIATLPLKVFYRSGVRPGPGKDGQTVNARVVVEGWAPDFVGPTELGERPVLELHLALADLWTRGRDVWDPRNPRRTQAKPLGIAADTRWIWHEIGHVLLMCSVGELEFRFAHSAGDSLAAIVCDPQSALAGDDNWRGATFPWVFTPRRHDRCVLCGWGWGGTLHYDMSLVPDTTLPRRKGYWTEQILSSSLFRFYRAVGGDTVSVGPPAAAGGPGETIRQSASHYAVYLIMRAIQIMGTSGVQLANEPDQFVSALIDADIGTLAWNVAWTLPYDVLYQPPVANVAFAFDRVGGCVWKVIRWAFEAQGLYGPAATIANTLGSPPPVDVYIPDLRPTTESTRYGDVDYGAGAYVPVSLDFDPAQTGASPAPNWQADPVAGIVVAGGSVTVMVGNRGTEAAAGVVVTVWWIAWPAASPTPVWNAGAWNASAPSAAQSIGPHSTIPFGPFAFTPAAGTRSLVFAQATCPDDPANSDPATGFPCATNATPLVDLVANDNNLGLVVIGP
jgi:hypothetical protein